MQSVPQYSQNPDKWFLIFGFLCIFYIKKYHNFRNKCNFDMEVGTSIDKNEEKRKFYSNFLWSTYSLLPKICVRSFCSIPLLLKISSLYLHLSRFSELEKNTVTPSYLYRTWSQLRWNDTYSCHLIFTLHSPVSKLRIGSLSTCSFSIFDVLTLQNTVVIVAIRYSWWIRF